MSFDWTSLLGNNRLVMKNHISQPVKDLCIVKVVGLYFSAHVRFFLSVRALLRFWRYAREIVQFTPRLTLIYIHSGVLRVVNSHLVSRKCTKRSVIKDWVKCRCRWRSCSFPRIKTKKNSMNISTKCRGLRWLSRIEDVWDNSWTSSVFEGYHR